MNELKSKEDFEELIKNRFSIIKNEIYNDISINSFSYDNKARIDISCENLHSFLYYYDFFSRFMKFESEKDANNNYFKIARKENYEIAIYIE